jgi:hypothetical protein
MTITLNDRDDVIAVLDQFERDVAYIGARKDEWLAEFNDCWVVVYGEKLVGRANTLEVALKGARTVGATKNVAVELITREPRSLLL